MVPTKQQAVMLLAAVSQGFICPCWVWFLFMSECCIVAYVVFCCVCLVDKWLHCCGLQPSTLASGPSEDFLWTGGTNRVGKLCNACWLLFLSLKKKWQGWGVDTPLNRNSASMKYHESLLESLLQDDTVASLFVDLKAMYLTENKAEIVSFMFFFPRFPRSKSAVCV